ncbi:rCG27263 [Rattus norvegicus]|uniref:RCG27263 n=1 Tax=Rattus norvegicus TaxID=10116 RepID=A6HP00_RAT|nr:rCG27263 [Rattus norvegicus]
MCSLTHCIFELFTCSCKDSQKHVLSTAGEGFGEKGFSFHRIFPRLLCQGGDFRSHPVTGGKSIYEEKFESKNFEI